MTNVVPKELGQTPYLRFHGALLTILNTMGKLVFPGITDHRHISRIVGSLWKNMAPSDKKVWETLAEQEKEEHRR